MSEEKMEKTVYYSDELSDEFSGIAPKNFFIPKDYRYIHRNLCYRFFAFIVYRLLLLPFAILHHCFGLHQKFVNRKVLKPFRKQGYFLYGNHTNQLGGGFTPNLLCFPKKVYLLVNPDNVSSKVFGPALAMAGALPLPSTLEGMLSLQQAIGQRLKEGAAIGIYPEAHIWPYCTWVRHFKAVSFKYPVKYGTPVFCFTDCYQKRRFSKKPKTVTYVDGPFFPDESLPVERRHIELAERVYETMAKRAKENSTYEVIHYVKKEADHD